MKLSNKSFFSALFAVALLLSLSQASQAQVFNKGDIALNVGIGLGSVYGYSGFSSSVPPLSASLEVGITDKIGIGRFGVGGILGYSSYKFSTFNSVTSSHILIGGRGLYHFDFDVEKLDLYAGIMLGYNIISYSDNATGVFSGSGVVGGVFGGARYMFSEKIGAFGELGYSIAWLNIGITAKF
jgi:Outer membrane protein beta-barrel domain